MLLFCLFMIMGLPIAVCLALGSMGAMVITGQYSVLAIVHKMAASVDTYVLIAIPFFILAGNLMNVGGITNRIFAFASALVGHIPGGLGHANVISSIIFSGMSGSAVADAGGLGQIIMKAMREEGYDAEFSAAVTCASATIGPIVPPSIPMVIFGAMAEVSIGALFVGGFIPGLLLGGATMVLVYIIARRRKYPKSTTISLARIASSFKQAFLALLTPVIIIGGILTGVCTPTEAAVIASVYALALSVLYREVSWRKLGQVLLNTTVMSSSIIFIIAAASAFSWVIAMEGVPQYVTRTIMDLTGNKYIIILLLNLVLLFMGMFLESLAILTIIVPFLMPLITIVGIDPVHLGVMVVLNLMIGLSTPPIGLSLFICGKIANVKLERLYWEIIPFLIPLISVLVIISLWPGLVLFLPNLILN